MVQNDPEAIGRFMADDWTIIGSDGTSSDKAAFLGLIRSDMLSHDVMRSDDITVRMYGGAAVITARGVRSTISPVSRSSMAIVCCAACKSQPIIRISASFDPSAVRVDTAQSTRAVVGPTSL